MSNSDFRLVSPDSFNPRSKALVDPIEVRTRLQQLHPDLTPELLFKAIFKGLSARHEATSASAPTARGGMQWYATVEGVRSLLMEKQWNTLDQRNCPFVISPDRSIAIVAMTGNSETGKQGFEDPSTAADKGAVALAYVEANRQLKLFHEQEGTQVWALLYHYDQALKEVRYEFSLPTDFTKRKISVWDERLILRSIPDDPTDFTIRKDEPNAPATVEVQPKTGT